MLSGMNLETGSKRNAEVSSMDEAEDIDDEDIPLSGSSASKRTCREQPTNLALMDKMDALLQKFDNDNRSMKNLLLESQSVALEARTTAERAEQMAVSAAAIAEQSRVGSAAAGQRSSANEAALAVMESRLSKAEEVAKNAIEVATRSEDRNARLEDKFERFVRCTELVMSGVPIPEEVTEDYLIDLVSRIAKATRFGMIRRDMLERVYVIPRTDLIVVKFANQRLKREFFHKYIILQPALRLSALDIKYADDNRIFLADNLTHKNAEIRRRAAGMKKDGLIHSHTIKNGLVSIQVRSGDRRRPIMSLDELDEVTAAGEDLQDTVMEVDESSAPPRPFQSRQATQSSHGNGHGKGPRPKKPTKSGKGFSSSRLARQPDHQ